MGEFSITHLLLLLVVFLIFFGPSRLPALGQSLGKAIRGFKSGLNEIDADAREVKDNATSSNLTEQQALQLKAAQLEAQLAQIHAQQAKASAVKDEREVSAIDPAKKS